MLPFFVCLYKIKGNKMIKKHKMKSNGKCPNCMTKLSRGESVIRIDDLRSKGTPIHLCDKCIEILKGVLND